MPTYTLKAVLAGLFITAFTFLNGFSSANLMNIEAQFVGSYDTASEDFHLYSHHLHDVMQKPSIGFDYTGKFGSSRKDWGTLALQMRLAYDENEDSKLRLQIYNAYLKMKSGNFDYWIGHNRPAAGLNSYLDNHSLLMTDNIMSGLSYDRDWGIGLVFDRQNPIVSVSATTGSGMPLEIGENFLLNARVGLGDFTKDNLSIGISGTAGNVLRSMGYEVMHNGQLHKQFTIGGDASLRIDNLTINADLIYGSYHDQTAYAGLLRITDYILPEERANVQVQARLQEIAGAKQQHYSIGAGYKLNSHLSINGLYSYLDHANAHQVSLQIYYLRGFVF